MWRVVKAFFDLQDDFHAYAVGDTFPRSGAEVSAERAEYLASGENRLGAPVIEKVEQKTRKSKKTEE